MGANTELPTDPLCPNASGAEDTPTRREPPAGGHARPGPKPQPGARQVCPHCGAARLLELGQTGYSTVRQCQACGYLVLDPR